MKGTLEKKRTWANNQAFGPLLKFDPILGDIKKSFDTIYDSLNNGSRPLKTSFHVIGFRKIRKGSYVHGIGCGILLVRPALHAQGR